MKRHWMYVYYLGTIREDRRKISSSQVYGLSTLPPRNGSVIVSSYDRPRWMHAVANVVPPLVHYLGTVPPVKCLIWDGDI